MGTFTQHTLAHPSLAASLLSPPAHPFPDCLVASCPGFHVLLLLARLLLVHLLSQVHLSKKSPFILPPLLPIALSSHTRACPHRASHACAIPTVDETCRHPGSLPPQTPEFRDEQERRHRTW